MSRLRRAWVTKSPSSSLRSTSRRTFGRHLEPDEEVIAVANATHAGAGASIATGAVVGALCGALVWTLLETAAFLPQAILGAFAGIIGGALVARRRARSAAGPGATLVRLVLTDQRLLTLRQRSAVRFAPLRSHRLEHVDQIESRPAPLGSYRTTTVTLHDGTTVQFLVAGPHDFAVLWEGWKRTSGEGAAAEEETTR